MKTAKEVLTKYSDGDYSQFKGYENILMAMEEYAKKYHESRTKEECCHPFEKVISAGALHNCTVCGQNIEVATRKTSKK